MITTQTIELDECEKETIENALGIIDRISDIANCSMDDVCDYFCRNADICGTYNYSINNEIQISDIR